MVECRTFSALDGYRGGKFSKKPAIEYRNETYVHRYFRKILKI